ncbi:MAG: DUF4242 domain-containing protein [Dehalococcoidia bacterium]|nr:DUF4242 domain-containing protein [Dehalococcoidia bacterium]
MALFVVRRNVEGLGQEDIDAAAYRAIMCSYEYPGMKWHRSYWDSALGVLDCVYEAHDADEIREHAKRSRIPCDDVRPVEEIDPTTYLSG